MEIVDTDDVTHHTGSTMHRTEKGLQNTKIYIYNYMYAAAL